MEVNRLQNVLFKYFFLINFNAKELIFLNSYFILDEEFQTFLCLIYAQFYLKNIINRCYQIKSYCFLFFAITIISVFNQCMANV